MAFKRTMNVESRKGKGEKIITVQIILAGEANRFNCRAQPPYLYLYTLVQTLRFR